MTKKEEIYLPDYEYLDETISNKYVKTEKNIKYVKADADIKAKSVSKTEMYSKLPPERLSATIVWNKVRPKATSISKEKEPKGGKKDPFSYKG